ncbi:hypothetical protein [Paraburkholderia elongata]|uniref:DUF3828 domain-containing protein n=1 Tax=Paraburkholderia elongata TaxID=2675747 RepID=A0A972SP54_9BURK|nr:hypothetical protein [Paraburkholderia elongata]NPT61932.1 hypothetical protein [Paraburkholderia elongata]
MKLHQIAGAALLGLYLQAGNAETSTPRSVTRAVADWTIKDGSVGLPHAGDEPFESSFSKGLLRSMADARAENDRQEKAYPDSKPPFAEISVVVGIPDAVSSYRIARVRQTHKTARVTLDWQLKGDPTVARTQMQLAPQGARWVITNILYGTGHPPRSLSQALQLRD